MVSLTLAEARRRAASVADVAYDVELDLTEPAAERFGSVTTVRFTARAPETFLELADATDVRVELDGERVDAPYDGARVWLTGLGGPHEVRVAARLPFRTDGEGMHRFVDPDDRETYLSAYLGMDLTQRVVCCFDQNDLKATFAVGVRADPAWTVLANGVASTPEPGRWEFSRTPLIPPALLVVAAGPWASVTWEHRGLPFGWHARRSLAAELERDTADLRAVTEACFDHYARLFEEPYPFDSYDQVFVPGLNWGAQEMPGCVTYRDEMLWRGRVTSDQLAMRTSVIAHEMSHMWFGDLATMTWWEDTWLQESFADYLGDRVAEDAVGRPQARLLHEAREKPEAYDADLRRSTHPVAPRPEDVGDVDAAATIFDAISYAKGASVVRQLVAWLGDEVFLRGINLYLGRHRFANATLSDVVACLDEVSERDVPGWVEGWLRRSGHDTLRVERSADGTVVVHRDGTRSHRVRVGVYDDRWRLVDEPWVDLADAPVVLEAPAGRVVVPDSRGDTFAGVDLDPTSWRAVERGFAAVAEPLTRAALWNVVLRRLRERTLDPAAYVDVLARSLVGETEPAIVTAVVGRTLRTLPRRVSAADAPDVVAGVARACAAGLARTGDEDLASAFAHGLVPGTRDVDALTGWLRDGAVGGPGGPRVPLTPDLRWTVVRRLTELGAADERLVAQERERDRSAAGELAAARALAARPTEAAKEAAWAAASRPDVGNRHLAALLAGTWSVEQVALVAPYVDRYLREAPAWAARGQGFAQVVGQAFPTVPLDEGQLAALAEALRGDVPVVLRRFWQDALDDRR